MLQSTLVMDSSWVARLDYQDGRLVVHTKQGKTITYTGIPYDLWIEVSSAPSVGKALNQRIIGIYSREA